MKRIDGCITLGNIVGGYYKNLVRMKETECLSYLK